jgi:predicted lipoprotein with Yx(FWY)xxD motif
MTIARARILSPLLLSVVLVAGCGSSSSSSSSSSSTTSAASPSTSSTTAATAPASSAMFVVTKHSKLGTILAAGPKHLTVYLFEADKHGKSNCTGECAKAWPPVTGTAKTGGKAVSADLGTIKRPDGKTQVTYKGHPLYFFIKDKDEGDSYGEGLNAFGSDWYVLAPSGKKVDKS